MNGSVGYAQKVPSTLSYPIIIGILNPIIRVKLKIKYGYVPVYQK